MLKHFPRPRRRRSLVIAVLAVALLGLGTSIALGLTSAGSGPFGEPLPPESTQPYPSATVSGPEVPEAAAIATAEHEAQADATPNGGSEAGAVPQAVARTSRNVATRTIGQGEKPAKADAEVAAWYEGAVYVVSFSGEYVARDAPVPPGARTPTGRYLTLVVDADSGKITGYELSKTVDLSPEVAAVRNES